jgi:hypothetical protein
MRLAVMGYPEPQQLEAVYTRMIQQVYRHAGQCVQMLDCNFKLMLKQQLLLRGVVQVEAGSLAALNARCATHTLLHDLLASLLMVWWRAGVWQQHTEAGCRAGQPSWQLCALHGAAVPAAAGSLWQQLWWQQQQQWRQGALQLQP